MPDLFAELSRNAKTYPHSLALISTSGNLEYRTLVETIENIAGHALVAGLTGGKIVHVETDNEDVRLPLFLGLMRAGATVALLQPTGHALIETGVDPDVVVTDRADRSLLAHRAQTVIRFTRDWFRSERRIRASLPERPDYALLFASSGSTGRQKLILESRTNIEHKLGRRLKESMYGGALRFLPGVGDTSHGTFPDRLITLAKGGSVIRPRRYSPDEIIAATCLLRPSYVKIAPKTLVDILKILDEAPRRFRKVDYLNLGGAYCAAAVRRAALESYAEQLFTSYGSTETSQVAWGEFNDISKVEGSVGWIDDGMTVETIDESGKPLPPGMEGEIRVKPPREGMTRYLTKDGPVDVLQDGWFYPGDIGRVDASGQLIITGRKTSVINIGGNKISPEVVEGVLLELDGIEDVAVAGVIGEHGYQTICALLVTKGQFGLDDVNAFLDKKRARFSIERLKVVGEIPRNANRKIDRPAVQAIASSA